MPKIKISQLSSYAAGAGFGSSVVKPTPPSIANLTSMNVFGSAYNEQSSDSIVKYYSSLPGLPAGITLEPAGLKMVTGNASRFTLGDLKESKNGTTFFFVTPSNDDASVTTATVPFIAGNDGRFTAILRYVDASGGETKPFVRVNTLSANRLTIASNGAIAVVKPNSSAFAINFDEPLLFDVTKDVANLKVITRIRQGNVYAKLVTSEPTLVGGHGSEVLSFGSTVATHPGPAILHVGGYYNNYQLTDLEFDALYQTLLDTVKSV